MNASSYKLKKIDSIFLSLQRQLSFVWILLLQFNTLWHMRKLMKLVYLILPFMFLSRYKQNEVFPR